MKNGLFWIVAGWIIAALLPPGFGMLRTATAADTAPDGSYTGGPVACVRTIPLKQGTIEEHIVVYGTVIAAPGALRTVSLPFESQVLSVMVNEGQEVSKGERLVRIQPSPDTKLQLDQAKNAYSLAQKSYQQMQRERRQQLATNQQLLQARQTMDRARLRLQSLQKRGIDGERQIVSSVDGLVKKINVQEGSIVAAGNPIMKIVAQDRIEVLLGVEIENIGQVHTGQAVALTRVNAPAEPEVRGKIRRISYAVDPITRLVDVFVSLTSPAGFDLGEAIQGKIVITSAQGWAVPRSAVLPEGDRYVLFTVQDGHAVKHTVDIGIENDKAYQIIAKDLQAGERVVVSGNYELTDGMAVTTEPCR